MIFRPTPIAGAFVIAPERHSDLRGYFARTWCEQEFAAHGVRERVVQANVSHNLRRHTVRGMHLQVPPALEGKLVRCTSGAIYDVVVDLRPQSPTFLQSYGTELTPQNGEGLYVPPLCAHGFLTLADETDVSYLMTGAYDPACAVGFRWNDPAFAIRWPETQEVTIAGRDASYADFDAPAWSKRLADAYARSTAEQTGEPS